MTIDMHRVKQQNNNMIEENKKLTMHLQQVKHIIIILLKKITN